MEDLRIQTTQNVDINYQLASAGDRILATLVDYLIFIVYALVVILIFYIIDYKSGPVILTLAFLPILLYDLLCEIFFDGKSIGKMALKIKVIKLDGTQAGFSAYFLRWVLRIIDTRILTPGVALLAVVVSEKGQRIGDMAAGTTVIKLKGKMELRDTILQPVIPNYKIVFSEVARLNDRDIHIIKDVLKQSIESGNDEAIELLAKKTKEVMGLETKLSDQQFLNTVVQDYSHYPFSKDHIK